MPPMNLIDTVKHFFKQIRCCSKLEHIHFCTFTFKTVEAQIQLFKKESSYHHNIDLKFPPSYCNL